MHDNVVVRVDPRVSVLLPVFNGAKYLRQAIASVLQQTFRDFELIAIDDGSTDESLRILRECESADDRVRVFSREHHGIALTRHELVRRARGTYLAPMDQDDICKPQRLQSAVAFLDEHPDYVLVGGWCETVSTNGMPIMVVRSPTDSDEIDQALLRGENGIFQPGATFRRTAALSVGNYRSEFEFAEDLDLWLRLAEIGKLANLPEVSIQYRLHHFSSSEIHGRLQHEAARRACEEAWRRRGIEGSFGAPERWRAGTDKASRHRFALQYGWAASANGHRRTAWNFALEALHLRPFAISSWKLLFFGCR